jgi:carboxymethylenebutenolidase
MCFDHDSVPPIAPIAGGSLDGSLVTLTAADGNAFAAFRARPASPGGAGVVILPDVRGLYAFYEELALRFAERGVDALAIDWFGRTAGVSSRDGEFDYAPHVARTTWAGISADIAAAVAALRAAGVERIFTIGFCMGGRMSFLAGSPHPCSGCSAGRMARSRPSIARPSRPRSRPPAWTIASSPTTAPRTASSIARLRSSPRPARAPGTRSPGSSGRAEGRVGGVTGDHPVGPRPAPPRPPRPGPPAPTFERAQACTRPAGDVAPGRRPADERARATRSDRRIGPDECGARARSFPRRLLTPTSPADG